MDPVSYPEIEIFGARRAIKINCGTLIRLKQQGLNLFDSAPIITPEDRQHAVLLSKAANSTDPAAQSAALAEAASVPISAARKNWVGPLDGDFTHKLEQYCKIIAVALSASDGQQYDALQVADAISLDQIRTIFEKVSEAIKKAAAEAMGGSQQTIQ